MQGYLWPSCKACLLPWFRYTSPFPYLILQLHEFWNCVLYIGTILPCLYSREFWAFCVECIQQISPNECLLSKHSGCMFVRMLRHLVVFDSLRPCVYPARILRPWDFPGKTTGEVVILFRRGVPNPRIEPRVPVLGTQSLSCWNIRKVPKECTLIF